MILGAYEEGGLVVMEFSDHPPARITWREALRRCQAVSQAEAATSAGRREPGIQRAVEQIIAAARDARKKDPNEANWTPPASVSLFRTGNKADISLQKRGAAAGLILPS